AGGTRSSTDTTDRDGRARTRGGRERGAVRGQGAVVRRDAPEVSAGEGDELGGTRRLAGRRAAGREPPGGRARPAACEVRTPGARRSSAPACRAGRTRRTRSSRPAPRPRRG